jgi:hypothetical protein
MFGLHTWVDGYYTEHIMDSTLTTTLDTLRVQRTLVETEVDGLKTSLASAEQRLSFTRGAIENIEALLGLSPFGQEPATGADVTHESPSIRDLTHDETPSAQEIVGDSRRSEHRFSLVELPERTRVPSTGRIAEIVNEAGRVLTRDEVFAMFERKFGFPESWTKPRNSLGNAINRAADKGWILRLDQNHFAPQDYEPYASRSLTEPGGQ